MVLEYNGGGGGGGAGVQADLLYMSDNICAWSDISRYYPLLKCNANEDSTYQICGWAHKYGWFVYHFIHYAIWHQSPTKCIMLVCNVTHNACHIYIMCTSDHSIHNNDITHTTKTGKIVQHKYYNVNKIYVRACTRNIHDQWLATCGYRCIKIYWNDVICSSKTKGKHLCTCQNKKLKLLEQCLSYSQHGN